ncbi:hypothetical protein CDD81_1861 [Ophiocordyceps australis]|uniref:Uncharacterized protein n=1 Tax=Ophiocordyceps australis TaxID=1399860 RepID=A0A2C5XY05_9HYPO|nr:hypothetical protein CDD81_1861 [Ophiocordyceps australis]
MFQRLALTTGALVALASAQQFEGSKVGGGIEGPRGLPDPCLTAGKFVLNVKDAPLQAPCAMEQGINALCEKLTGVKLVDVTDEKRQAFKECMLGQGSSYEKEVIGCVQCKVHHNIFSEDQGKFYYQRWPAAFKHFEASDRPELGTWESFQAIVGGDWDLDFNDLKKPNGTWDKVADPKDYYKPDPPTFQGIGSFTLNGKKYPEEALANPPSGFQAVESKDNMGRQIGVVVDGEQKPAAPPTQTSLAAAPSSVKNGTLTSSISSATSAAPLGATSSISSTTSAALPAATNGAGKVELCLAYQQLTNIVAININSSITFNFFCVPEEAAPVQGVERTPITKEEAKTLPVAPASIANKPAVKPAEMLQETNNQVQDASPMHVQMVQAINILLPAPGMVDVSKVREILKANSEDKKSVPGSGSGSVAPAGQNKPVGAVNNAGANSPASFDSPASSDSPVSSNSPASSKAPARGKPTKQVERAAWCGTGAPDSTLPCDMIGKLDANAIMDAGMDVTKEEERKSREKLVAYYENRKAVQGLISKYNDCCLKCKVDNKLLTPEQAKYWKEVADNFDNWAVEMEKFKNGETDVSPDTLFVFSKPLYDRGQPGAAIEDVETTQVPYDESCLAPPANVPEPVAPSSGSASGADPAPAIVPQPPLCHMAKIDGNNTLPINGNSAKFNTDVSANLAQQFCAAWYYVQKLVNGKMESSYVFGESVAIANTVITISIEQAQTITTNCGCNPKAEPVAAGDFNQKAFGTEAIVQAAQEDLSAKADVGAGNIVVSSRPFVAPPQELEPQASSGKPAASPQESEPQLSSGNPAASPQESEPQLSSGKPAASAPGSEPQTPFGQAEAGAVQAPKPQAPKPKAGHNLSCH